MGMKVFGKLKKFEDVIATTPSQRKTLRKQGYKVRKNKRRGQYVMRKKKTPWKTFEEAMLLLLQNGLKLTDVIGGSKAFLGRHQIDAAGGTNKTFFVIECKSTESPGFKSVAGAIKEVIGEQKEIRKGILKRFGSKYKHVEFIIAFNGISFTDNDLEYAREHEITLWSESYLEQLSDTTHLIGKYARYHVLREMGVENLPIRGGNGRTFNIPAYHFRHAQQDAYMFLMRAEDLLDLAYVSRIEGGLENAFQRLLSRKKLESVAKFIEEAGSFKNNLVVNFGQSRRIRFTSYNKPRASKHRKTARPRKRPTNNSEVSPGVIHIPKQYASMWLVDGQHRLYGYTRLKKQSLDRLNDLLPVIAMHDRDGTHAASTFVEINKNQKPVDSNILWALAGEVEKGDAVTISKAVRDLTENNRSKFRDKIYFPSLSKRPKRNYKLLISNVAKGIADRKLLGRIRRLTTVSKGRLKEDEALYYVLHTYFSLLNSVATSSGNTRWNTGFFMRNNGFNIMLRVLDEILIYQEGKFSRSATKTLIQAPIIGFFDNYKGNGMATLIKRASSEAIRGEIAIEIITSINDFVPDFAAKYLRRHEQLPKLSPDKIVERIEKLLRKVVEGRLSKICKNWWTERIPQRIRERTEERMEQNERPYPWLLSQDLNLMNHVDFSDYSSIISSKQNWREVFEAIFVKKDVIQTTLSELNGIRKAVAHNRELTTDQVDQLRVDSRKIIRPIEKFFDKK